MPIKLMGIFGLAGWLRSSLWVSLFMILGSMAHGEEGMMLPGLAVQELPAAAQRGLDARNWRLDPAIFTEITPFTAPDIAILLPADQRDDPIPMPRPESVPRDPTTETANQP